jgi:hypothetical protein
LQFPTTCYEAEGPVFESLRARRLPDAVCLPEEPLEGNATLPTLLKNEGLRRPEKRLFLNENHAAGRDTICGHWVTCRTGGNVY